MQDLEFPAACQRLKLTPDGDYLFATGIHAPRVRVYELSQLSLKFERHFDAEVVDFQVRGHGTLLSFRHALGLRACTAAHSTHAFRLGMLPGHVTPHGMQFLVMHCHHAAAEAALQAWPPCRRGATIPATFLRGHFLPMAAQILTEDFSKAAFLCADRSVHLHARYGAHFRTRVPRFGRDLAYAPESANLLIAASSSEIYRCLVKGRRALHAGRRQGACMHACNFFMLIAMVHGLCSG